uniref:Uncharacterized protein n=1 Tax=viral metagenome TaxID=1070528 RepID=A0A6M3J6Z5_9ZZZZ
MLDIIHGYLADNVKIDKIADYAAAATDAVTSSELDMQDYDAVTFLGSFGTAATNNTLTLYHSATSGAEVASSAVTTPASSDEDQVLDVQHPIYRYVKCVATRGTSSTLEYLVAIRYKSRSKAIENETAGTQSVDKFDAPASA